jgi:hypothetical protein
MRRIQVARRQVAQKNGQKNAQKGVRTCTGTTSVRR